MKCPICIVDLVITERQQVEIDYCPKCRGVWLDRGELDKIIEQTNQIKPRHGYYVETDSLRKKRKDGFLGEYFDF